LTGEVIIGVGFALFAASNSLTGSHAKIGLGRLSGDIVTRRDNFGVYIPPPTSLLVSVIPSPTLWLANRKPSALLAQDGRRSQSPFGDCR
jgi:Protein of unknown function (DUF2905)